MASRPRSTKKRGWPDGLYERGGYYSWRNPLTGKEMGIGRVTFGEAKAQAAEANVAVAGLRDKPRLVDRLEGRDSTTWLALIECYEKKLQGRELAKKTRESYASWLKRIKAVWTEHLDVAADRVTTRMIARGLETVKQQHPRTAQALRSRLHDMFNVGIAEGFCKANPVEVTDEVTVKVKRARLTWEVFKAAYDKMPPGRRRNAAALALVSGQPRETLAIAQFSEVGVVEIPGQGPVECWKTVRGKTGAALAIALDLRLEVFGMSLRDVIKQCRATGIASRYMVHNTDRDGRSGRLGDKMTVDQIGRDFSAAIAALEIDWGDRTPPTLHEVRSLAKRLYKAQGNVDTKDLLGHSTEQMSKLYADARGAEYLLVGVK